MANKRTFWACEGLGTATHGSGTTSATAYTYVPGVQSVGMTTNFNLEQIFQLGQLEIYQDLEEVPDVELTVEKVMDQHKLVYNRCMDHAAPTTVTIVADQNNRVDIGFVVTADTNENIGDAGNLTHAYMSGMFVSSANFNFDSDGYFTESITLVGNHKIWTAGAGEIGSSPAVGALDTGDVMKRQRFYMLEAESPNPIKALITADASNAAISSASVSVDFGREEINVLGRRQPYHRYVTFPVEVTCDIEAYVTDAARMTVDAKPDEDNTTENTIILRVQDAAVGADVATAGAGADVHTFDLGTKNRLQSVTWNGLDTGGTNATITYSYRNFNKLSVMSAGPNTS
mgnify:CR=1 FL=1